MPGPSGGAKFATGFVELSILDSSMLKRAHTMTAQVAGTIERQVNSRLADSFDRIGDRLQSLGFEATVAFAGVSLVVGNIVQSGWEMAKSVSSARNIFHQFGMEADAATAFVDELYDKSNLWATDFNTVLESAIKLWPAFNGNVDDVRYAMEGLYNVTGKYHLGQEAVNGVMRAFVQVAQKGKVQAEEMLQISEWGVDSWGLFSDALGITTQELRDMTMRGEALAEDILPKVYKYLNENPEFAGMATAQAETLSGQVNILHNQLAMLFGGPIADQNDALVNAFRNLNSAIETLNNSGFVAEFLTPVINAFATFTEWLATLDGGTVAMIAGIVGLAAVIGPLLVVLGSVFNHIGEGTASVARFNGRIAATTKAVGRGAVNAFRYLRTTLQNTGVSIGWWAQQVNRAGRAVIAFNAALLHPWRTLKTIGHAFADAARAVGRFSVAIGKGAASAARAFGRAMLAVPGIVRAVPGVLKSAGQSVWQFGVNTQKALNTALHATVDFVADFGGNMRRIGAATWTGMRNLGQAIRTGAVSGFKALVAGARSARDALERGLARAVGATASAIKRLGTVAAQVARDGIKKLGQNAGNIARGGMAALRTGLLGAALAAGALLASGAAIGPAIADAGDQVIAVIQGLPVLAQELATQLPGIIREAVATLALVLPELVASISEGAPLILQAIVDSLSILGNAAVQAAPTLLALAVDLVGRLADYLALNLPKLVDGFMTIFPDIVAGIGTAASSLVAAIAQLVPPLLQAIVNAIPVIVSGFVTLFPILITSILEALPGLVSAFLSAVPLLIVGIIEAIPSIVESVVSMIPKIISTLVPMLPQIVVGFLLLAPQLITAILGAIPDIVRSVVKMIPQIASALIDALPEAVDAFMELWPEIKSAWSDAYDEFKQLGRDLIEAIKDGLAAAWDSVTSWVSDKVSSIDLNPFSVAEPPVSLPADTSAASAALKPLAATFSAADVSATQSARTFDAGTFASAVDGLGSIEIDATATVPVVDVRVFIGDTELTDLVRAEIRYADDREHRFTAAGV